MSIMLSENHVLAVRASYQPPKLHKPYVVTLSNQSGLTSYRIVGSINCWRAMARDSEVTINLAYSSSLALAQDSSSRLLAVNMFCFAKLSILSKIFDMNFLIKSTDFASVSGIIMIKTIPLRSRYCASFPRSALCMLLMCDLRWILLISVASPEGSNLKHGLAAGSSTWAWYTVYVRNRGRDNICVTE